MEQAADNSIKHLESNMKIGGLHTGHKRRVLIEYWKNG